MNDIEKTQASGAGAARGGDEKSTEKKGAEDWLAKARGIQAEERVLKACRSEGRPGWMLPPSVSRRPRLCGRRFFGRPCAEQGPRKARPAPRNLGRLLGFFRNNKYLRHDIPFRPTDYRRSLSQLWRWLRIE